MGHPKKSTDHELRQAESLSTLLLRERHHAESGRRALRVSLHQLQRALLAQPGARGAQQRAQVLLRLSKIS